MLNDSITILCVRVQFICASAKWINSSQSLCIRRHQATPIGRSRPSPAFSTVSIPSVMFSTQSVPCLMSNFKTKMHQIRLDPAAELTAQRSPAFLTCKNRLPYNLYWVGGDVKHCTIQSNQSELLPYGYTIKHPVPDRVKPLFVIFDIRALWRSVLSVRMPGCQKLQMTA